MKENNTQLRSAEEVFKAQAKKEWLEGASFSSPVGSLNRIPFVVYPAVFKAMEEYAEQFKAENKALKNECTYLSNQSIAIDKIIFSEDLSIFEKVQEIQKLLTVMTLQECKDQVAVKHRFKDWEDVVLQFQTKNYIDEVAETYASQFKKGDQTEQGLPLNFWKRLEMFVSEVQVNDPMSEEEKEMILRVSAQNKGNSR